MKRRSPSRSVFLSSLAQSEAGSSLVEFTVTVGVFLLLLFGVMEGAMMLYTYGVVNDNARAGARYAIVHGSGCSYLTTVKGTPTATSCYDNATGSTLAENSTLETFIQNYTLPVPATGTMKVYTSNTYAPGGSACLTTGCAGSGDQVTVKITCPFNFALPFVPLATINMAGTSTMIISQ
jgi:Flp pilus assembly protein TadG